jgi:Spx/MgsR family transcriptional regulator
MIVVYGLKACDSCRKALKLLQGSGQAHRFHDLRGEGLPPGQPEAWMAELGWETLLNRKSTTWRELPEAEKQGLDATAAAGLMKRHPTLIKRPVIEAGDTLLVGIGAPQQAALKALA